MRIYTFSAIIFFFIIILIATEIYLKNIGLGNPVRYDSDLTYGYAPKINQKTERLKKSIVTINDVGLRSLENWKKNNKKKILFIGDSITYGGSYIDDTETFSYLVCTKMKDYEEKYWTERAGRYNKTSWVKDEDFIDAFLGMLPEQIFNSILEVGVGTGAVAEKVVENIGPLIGIDISKEMISKINNPNITAMVGDAHKLEFDNNTFDLYAECYSLY